VSWWARRKELRSGQCQCDHYHGEHARGFAACLERDCSCTSFYGLCQCPLPLEPFFFGGWECSICSRPLATCRTIVWRGQRYRAPVAWSTKRYRAWLQEQRARPAALRSRPCRWCVHWSDDHRHEARGIGGCTVSDCRCWRFQPDRDAV
jgi:hypothetical protein